MGCSLKGKDNPNWKGGRTTTEHGYVLILVEPGHHLANAHGYAYEHRLIAEQNLGRRLKQGEIAHHRNGDRTDNHPDNIAVLPSIGHHIQAHSNNKKTRRIGSGNPMIQCACGCKATFLKFDTSGRPRSFVSGHNLNPKDGRI